MEERSISLAGDWRLTGTSPDCDHCTHDLRAVVPGAVHQDLLRAGVIPDPFWRDNAEQCQWVERWAWNFRREFDLPSDWDGQWCELECMGLDTYSTVRINGQVVGASANMFVPHRFDVGSVLIPGARNTIEVSFAPHHKVVADKPFGLYLSVFSADRVFSRKMQCGFGWDWVHRLLNVGIWGPVTLRRYEGVRVTDLHVRTESLGASEATLHVEVTTESRAGGAPTMVEVEFYSHSGDLITRFSEAANAPVHSRRLTIQNPELWWPRGQGGQPLYRCRVRVLDASGQELDQREISFGIRTIEIEQVVDAKGSGFVFVVNGRRVFAKGGNWVPPSPFPGTVTTGHYERLLTLAADANCNMLRAWGGGVYEPEPFWEACDRLGIMVWQDFQMACAYYPEDRPEFMAAMRAEAPAAIRMLRNHPSLVLWCGDNEDGMNWTPESDYPGKKLATQITGPAVLDLSPHVPFWPTSPYGGALNKSPDSGDAHKSIIYDMSFYQGDMKDYRRRIDELPGRFLSESTTVGAPPKEALLKFMTEHDAFEDPTERMWHYHTKDNPCNPSVHHYHMLRDAARAVYGTSDDPEQELRHKEYWQYEVTRLTAEMARRRWHHCGGLLFWMYNDCWPASGWSHVDYYGNAKAGYYGLKKAFAPMITSILATDDAFEIWVCNDHPFSISGTVVASVQPFASGKPRWSSRVEFVVPANSSMMCQRVSPGEVTGLGSDSILVADATAGDDCDRAFYFPGVPADMELKPVQLQVETSAQDGGGSVQITARGAYARVVTIVGEVDPDDNYFDLLPDESRTIRWTTRPGSPDASPEVTCWNAAKLPTERLGPRPASLEVSVLRRLPRAAAFVPASL